MKRRGICSLALAIFMASMFTLTSIAFGGGPERKFEVKDGFIYFPERDSPDVLLSKINNKFPEDMPPALQNMKGNVYVGYLDKPGGRSGVSYGQNTHLILNRYDSETKEIDIYFVWEKGYGGKPAQGNLRGTYDPEGTMLRVPVANAQTYRLTFNKKGMPEIYVSNGFSAEYKVQGKLPESW